MLFLISSAFDVSGSDLVFPYVPSEVAQQNRLKRRMLCHPYLFGWFPVSVVLVCLLPF